LLAERYRVGEPLGTGGMGTVYLAHDERLDRAVAIKVLRRDLADDPSFRRRFEREARSAARITHPHAVTVYDTGEDASHHLFIVMELLSGRTLADEMRGGPLAEARLLAVADHVLGALGAAHAQGVVHRDVKPSNILLADDGGVKIGDFGIATSLDPSETTTIVPLGTPAYTAPERLRGLPATERSDLYSFGVVLYEAATGARPYAGRGAEAVAEAVVAGEHEPLSARRPDLAPSFVAGVERALAIDPKDRFADADEMRAALRSRSAPPSASVRPTEPLTFGVRTAVLTAPKRPEGAVLQPTRGPRWRWAVALLAVVLLVIAVVMLAVRDDSPPTASPVSTTALSAEPPVVTVTSAPVPESLARAIDRLEEATQP
jgi:serine/threonine-protein kinase